jgi:hypothetical protein
VNEDRDDLLALVSEADETPALERVLADGRTLHLYQQLFNVKMTISTPRELANLMFGDSY